MKYRQRIVASFVLASLLLFVVAGAVSVNFSQLNRQKRWVDHTYEVIASLQEVLSNLKDVQSSQRGFVITGMEDYLVPYHIALPKVEQGIVDLRSLLRDNPEQLTRLNNLSLHATERIKIAENIIALYKEKGQAQVIEAIKVGGGKREMDQIRAVVAEMIIVEKDLLKARRAAMDESANWTIGAGILGLLICFIILMLVFYLISREARYRARTEAELKKAFSDVDIMNRETQAISQLGDYLRGCQSTDEAYQVIQKSIPFLFPDTNGAVYTYNNSRNLLQNSVHWGDIETVSEFEPEDCWGLRQGRPHECFTSSPLPICDHISNVAEGRATSCVPMQAQGETFGLIYVEGDKDVLLKELRLSSLRSIAEKISLALANLRLQSVLREQSIKDPLTRLFNRRYLEETLVREHARAVRNNQTIAILMMDIDFFKKVNDTYGHDGGDAVLVAFAGMLAKKVRKEDIACRLGGEEFVFVLPAASLDLAIQRAKEINEATRDMKINHANQTITITVSIGIAVMPDHGDMIEDVMQRADQALYEAKKGGRDRAIVSGNS